VSTGGSGGVRLGKDSSGKTLELRHVEDIVNTITNRQVDFIGIVTNKLRDSKGTFKLQIKLGLGS
jgi:hypothetical protein